MQAFQSGFAAQTPPSNNPGQQNPQAVQRGATRLRATYLTKLDEYCKTLIENYGNIIKSAKINEKVQNSRENFQLDVCTNNIIYASESLLRMITELKHHVLLNDYPTINENNEKQNQFYENFLETGYPAIAKLQSELNYAMWELETEYYSSPYRTDS